MPYLYMGTIVPLSVAIPILVGTVKYKMLDRPLRTIFWFLVVNGLANVIAKLLSLGKVTNLPVSHLYTVVELFFLLLFYGGLFKETRLAKLVPAITAIFFALAVVNASFFQKLTVYNSYTRSIEAILIIFLAVAYFMRQLDRQEQPANGNTLTTINAALLLYFSGALILFIISNFVAGNVALGTAIWNVHATLVLLMYLMIAAGLWILKT